MVKKVDVTDDKCPICKHEDRASIEMVGLMGAFTWNMSTKRINNTFGTHFKVADVENHMKSHLLTRTVADAGVILSSMVDDEVPRVSFESILQTLLIQGMRDVAAGALRCKTPRELIDVAQTLMNLQRSKETQLAFGDGDVSSFYTVLAAFGEAMRDTLPPSTLDEVARKASALGAKFNIGNLRLERPEVPDVSSALLQCVRDHEELGHGRTRDELVKAGVIPALDVEVYGQDGDMYDHLDELDLD